MNCKFAELTPEDRRAVIDIFNFFIEKSFAAYPDRPVDYEFFDHLLAQSKRYPALTVRLNGGPVLGFGLLRPHHFAAVFSRAADLTYFLMPEIARQGVGGALLGHLSAVGGEMGIKTLLASISSLNAASLAFHRKHGFAECGRFKSVGRKCGLDFDVVWMQKFLS